MKILVVEDEKGLAESIVDFLSREGFICEVANTFWQADEKISLYQYDCTIVECTRKITDQAPLFWWQQRYDIEGNPRAVKSPQGFRQ